MAIGLMANVMGHYFLAATLTLAIEVPIAVALLRHWRVPPRRALRVALGVNVVSHPAAYVLMLSCRSTSYATAVFALVEVAVAYFEAWCYARRCQVGAVRSLAVSGLANVASLSFGLFLWSR